MKPNNRRLLIILLILGGISNFCFSQNTDTDNKFIIVLDVQKYSTDLLASDSCYQTFIDSLNFAIEHSNAKNVIYIMTAHLQLNISLTYPNIYVSLDAESMQFDERMLLVNKHIFLKEDMGNAFMIEALNNFLKTNNAKEIILIGLMAEECIYQSCIGGLEQAYDMYILPEAIIGESKESKDQVIKELIDKGVKIIKLNRLENRW